MRMQVTALLLVCLGAWIHTAESGPAEEFDASTTYPEDQDGSGDDLELSGSGSGGDEMKVPDFAAPSNATAAPEAAETTQVAVTTEQKVPVEAVGETTRTRTTLAATTSEAPPTAGTPTTAVAAANAGAGVNMTADSNVTADSVDATSAPATTAASTGMAATSAPATTAASTGMAATSAPATTAASTGMAATSAVPGHFNTTEVPWELPEEPLRETTSANPVSTEAAATPPYVMGTSAPDATESGPAETTPSLLTTQSSPTTAVPPVPVDTGVEFSTEASTRTPVLTEEEEEGDEEEEETPTHIEETDMPPASTPAFETDLEEIASGEEPIPASTVSPWATNSVEPAGPLIPDIIIPETRRNVEMEKPEVPSASDYDIVFVPEVSEDEVKTDETVSENQSLLERKEVLGGVIAGGVVGLAFAIMLVSLMVYRMKKKDEGSYALDEHKHPNGGYQKARRQEEFLA